MQKLKELKQTNSTRNKGPVMRNEKEAALRCSRLAYEGF